METALALAPSSIDPGAFFKPEQVQLIKRQIAKGVTDDELKLFLYQCARTGLDPFSRQIYALERREKDGDRWVSKMSIQTGIDGLRLIADRTGRYAPGPDNEYEYDAAGNLRRATAHVRKRTGDGTWHVISASAFFSEYAQTRQDGKPTKMWAEKPHIMLGKCAEALALRKAFPAEMSGIYTSDEMGQTEVAAPADYTPPPATPATSSTSQPALAVVSPPKDEAPSTTPGASDGSDPSTDGTTTGTTDGGDLGELKKALAGTFTAQHRRNFLKKYWPHTGGEVEKLALHEQTDCWALLDAWAEDKLEPDPEIAKTRPKYNAKLAELMAAGRIPNGEAKK